MLFNIQNANTTVVVLCIDSDAIDAGEFLNPSIQKFHAPLFGVLKSSS